MQPGGPLIRSGTTVRVGNVSILAEGAIQDPSNAIWETLDQGPLSIFLPTPVSQHRTLYLYNLGTDADSPASVVFTFELVHSTSSSSPPAVALLHSLFHAISLRKCAVDWKVQLRGEGINLHGTIDLIAVASPSAKMLSLQRDLLYALHPVDHTVNLDTLASLSSSSLPQILSQLTTPRERPLRNPQLYQYPHIHLSLFPYQLESVAWMLEREGVTEKFGHLVPQEDQDGLVQSAYPIIRPLCPTKGSSGKGWFFNQLTGHLYRPGNHDPWDKLGAGGAVFLGGNLGVREGDHHSLFIMVLFRYPG